MGHARCEELMGFNMGLASMCMEEKWRDEDGGCSSYVLWRSVGVPSEMEVAEFVKQNKQTFRGTAYSFRGDSTTQPICVFSHALAVFFILI
jgi:hypothetical protein